MNKTCNCQYEYPALGDTKIRFRSFCSRFS